MTREQELDFLKNQAQALRRQLEQIKTRIQELGSDKEVEPRQPGDHQPEEQPDTQQHQAPDIAVTLLEWLGE